MDFLNRNGQSTQPARPAAAPGSAPQHAPVQNHEQHKGGNSFFGRAPGWLRVANVVLLFSMTILAVSIAWMLHNNNPNESKYIATSKYQAVFLENGQVYFGKIASLNSKVLNLQNVFYLNSQNNNAGDATNKDTSASSNQFTLVKLGCELHGPYDQMVVNRDQVTFWENLKDDGQVVKTIKEWAKQNPNGQKCSNTSATSNQSGASTQNTSSTGTGTNTNANSSTSTGTNTTTNKQQ
jgi:hypothetical protein